MTITKIALIAALSVLALSGCSDPRSTPLPADLSNVVSIKPQIEKLPEADRALLAAYLMRRSIDDGLTMEAPATTAATVGEAIDQQRALMAEQVAGAATAKADGQPKTPPECSPKCLPALTNVRATWQKSLESAGLPALPASAPTTP